MPDRRHHGATSSFGSRVLRDRFAGRSRPGTCATLAARRPRPGLYDLEVDTSLLSPQACADAIGLRLEDGTALTAFRRIIEGSFG